MAVRVGVTGALGRALVLLASVGCESRTAPALPSAAGVVSMAGTAGTAGASSAVTVSGAAGSAAGGTTFAAAVAGAADAGAAGAAPMDPGGGMGAASMDTSMDLDGAGPRMPQAGSTGGPGAGDTETSAQLPGSAGPMSAGAGSAQDGMEEEGDSTAVDADVSPVGQSSSCTGKLRYGLARAPNPDSTAREAYARITEAMDRALAVYNCHTDIDRALRVSYEPSVQTADGNPNGSIRFGAFASMNHITAMHEVSHTLGIGDAQWDDMVVDGVFLGVHATAQLRELTGNPEDVVHGDMQHFWPYGLNYTNEVMSEQDLIAHCLMVAAIREDLGY